MQLVEGAPLEQHHLAASRLLGGRADQLDRHAELVGDRLEAHGGSHGGGGDEVVPAGVAHAWQGVVLGDEGEPELAAAVAGLDRRRHVGEGAGDLEALRLEHRRDGPAADVLLEGQLGVGVDELGELDERRPGLLDGALRSLGRAAHRRLTR